MPTLSAPIRYTSRTAAQIREDLLVAIPTVAPSWTSHGEDEPGMALVDMLAGVADGIHYYFDKQALETYLPTVRLRKNAMSLSHLVGYRPRRTYGAQGTIIVFPSSPLTTSIFIPARTQLTTQGGVPLVTMEDTYLDIGFSGTRTVKVVQGEYRTTEIASTGGNEVAVTLPVRDPTEQLFRVSIYGQEWVEFRDSQPEDANNRWYHYFEDYDGTVTVRFLGQLGNVPMAGTPITVEYLLSRDLSITAATPVGAPSLADPVDLDAAGLTSYRANLDKLNYETGIIDNYRVKESVASLRYSAPTSVKTKNRAVSESDYQFLARQIGGVKDVSLQRSDFYTRQVVAHVLTEDGSAADVDLLAQVRDYLDIRNDLTLDVVAQTAVIEEFRCTVLVKERLGFTAAAAVYQVKEALVAFFKTTAFNFGRTIRLGEVYSVANDVASVDYVAVTALHWAADASSVEDLAPSTEHAVPQLSASGLVVGPVAP